MKHRIKAAFSALACGTVIALTAGCSTSIEDVPLPGGADVGSDPINLSITTHILDMDNDDAEIPHGSRVVHAG